MSDADFLRRYARHIMLPQIGEDGQRALAQSSVLVIGAGGLGSALIAYLCAAGVGRIGIIDHDHVELSNLQRQIIHEQGDIGRLKVESAADRISELNTDTQVDLYPRRITEQNASSIISRYDIVADGSDNFATRFAVNAACIAYQVPLVSAAIKAFDGQLAVFAPHLSQDAPCYQCFVESIPAEANNCTQVGVIGPLCGVMGSMQALEVLKLLLGLDTALTGSILRYNGLTHETRRSLLKRNLDCPACSPHQKRAVDA